VSFGFDHLYCFVFFFLPKKPKSLEPFYSLNSYAAAHSDTTGMYTYRGQKNKESTD